jgi:hypothetical protein
MFRQRGREAKSKGKDGKDMRRIGLWGPGGPVRASRSEGHPPPCLTTSETALASALRCI